MLKKIRQLVSVKLSKSPGRVVIAAILFLNIAFLALASLLIRSLSLSGTEGMGFWEAVFYTVTMILDAGCIQFVVADVGEAGVALVIVCLAVVMIGMVLFTGAVIGYLTNYISGFIDKANLGSHRLFATNHTVILNWNSRASEIVNDLLYAEKKETVVILVPTDKEKVVQEIDERLADTVLQENLAVQSQAKKLPFLKRRLYIAKHKFKNKLTILVREGDIFSTKQLRDISLSMAKSIIILSNNITNTACLYEHNERLKESERGNPQTVKTLIQVADITAAESSLDNQNIIVEIEDPWTLDLVQKIIANKEVVGKCKIIPINVNRVLGKLLAQFSLMPELNLVYRELFSNKGATFYALPYTQKDEHAFYTECLTQYHHAIPLALMNGYAYLAAEKEGDLSKKSEAQPSDYRVALNGNYWMERKNVVILGHNSKIRDIMDGFNSFRNEWNPLDGGEILNILIIDDEQHLEKMNYYRDYPYVTRVQAADIFNREIICRTVEEFVAANETDTSILILSDDTLPGERADTGAIANLIYIRDVINSKKAADSSFDESKIDLVVEIINPKHYDIVKSYSVNNVVISNRYVSKMITQLGKKQELYDFYYDILTYDLSQTAMESKELYIKKVSRFFDALPEKATADELICAVYNASREQGNGSFSIPLGYVTRQGEMHLLVGDRRKLSVSLSKTDKLIVFSNH